MIRIVRSVLRQAVCCNVDCRGVVVSVVAVVVAAAAVQSGIVVVLAVGVAAAAAAAALAVAAEAEAAAGQQPAQLGPRVVLEAVDVEIHRTIGLIKKPLDVLTKHFIRDILFYLLTVIKKWLTCVVDSTQGGHSLLSSLANL